MNDSPFRTKVLIVVLLSALLAASSSRASHSPLASPPQLEVSASTQSAIFAPNPGIGDAAILFRTLGGSGTLFFEQRQVVFQPPSCTEAPRWFSRLMETNPSGPEKPASPSSVRLHFAGANPNTQVVGQDQLPGIINYFLGEDPASWRTDVPTFGRLTYKELYPGIDLVYNGGAGVLKGTFLVAPGANPSLVGWFYEGASRVELSKGELLIGADESGQNPLFVERRPVAWQTVDSKRTAVDARYVVHPDSSIGFALGAYDAAQPLEIDPTLDYSTYWGGAGCDGAYDLALDSSNNVYIAGTTNSQGYPPAEPKCDQTRYFNAYITKLDPSKTGTAQHVYTTYIGGSGFDMAFAIGVDAAGNACAAGPTDSKDLPTTKNAYQRIFKGGMFDCMVFQLNTTGAVKYLSYLGGKDIEELMNVAVGDNSLVYVTGFTSSSDFPTTSNAYSRLFSQGEAYVSVLDTSKSGAASLTYSTFYGGSGFDEGYGLAVANGIIYLAGPTSSKNLPLKNPIQAAFKGGNWGDGYAAILDPSKSGAKQLLFATYLGGSKNDLPGGIVPSGTDYIYVVGTTGSSDFPTTRISPAFGGNLDGFLTKIDVTAPTKLKYGRFVGGSGRDGIRDVVVDSQDNAYVAGGTGSANLQTAEPLQATFKGGAALSNDAWMLTTWGAVDALIAKFDPTGKMTFGTFWGGTGADGAGGIRLGTNGKVYVAGGTRSKNIRLVKAAQKTNAGQYDAFVIAIGKLAPSSSIPVTSSSGKD
ncbi:MAG: SBBP repeat-containing protein [Candidatus Aminicenantes bacterium]|nr:SBBP repeat-containing protein [Candidatus Aminicenantes bacterium]